MKEMGEPYKLSGKRIVFLNWHYIRAGGARWADASGKALSSSSSGPWDASYKLVDAPYGVKITSLTAKNVGPLLEPEKPWEEKGIAITTVIQYQGLFRGWGHTDKWSQDSRAIKFCYFESEDGLVWKRPSLRLVEFQGSLDNNLLNSRPMIVFDDSNGVSSERYKGVSEGIMKYEEFEHYRKKRPFDWANEAIRPDMNGVFCIRGAVSSDGIHWTELTEPLSVEHSDTQVVAYYDSNIEKYVMYTRNYSIGVRSTEFNENEFRAWWGGDGNGPARRSIGRSESPDFRQFPVSEVIIEPGPDMSPTQLLYTNCRTTIPGAPDHHLMFPAIWDTSVDTTSIALASSHNGKLWHFVPGSRVLETSSFGNWDGGCVFASPNLVELPNGDWALPYTGYNFPHKYPRFEWHYQPGYAVWQKGRLVALESPEEGYFATVAIMPPGRKLMINAVTSRAGSIVVEVVDMNGQPIPNRNFADSIPIVGDKFRSLVGWNEGDDLGHVDGKAIYLRFRMNKAKIFGIEFV